MQITCVFCNSDDNVKKSKSEDFFQLKLFTFLWKDVKTIKFRGPDLLIRPQLLQPFSKFSKIFLENFFA